MSCTERLELGSIDENVVGTVSSREAGDGIYESLGYGYDITEEYLGENSVRMDVIDIVKFKKENEGRFHHLL